MRLLSLTLFLVAVLVSRAASASYDVVIYGGTSGGVAAAIQAARLGKTAVLIEPTQFLGGLTTGGLGATDIGNKRAIGGISREFYGRIWEHYQQPSAWPHQTRDSYINRRGGAVNAEERTLWTFEPHAATKVFDDMLREVANRKNVREAIELCLEVRAERGLPLTSEAKQIEVTSPMPTLPTLSGPGRSQGLRA